MRGMALCLHQLLDFLGQLHSRAGREEGMAIGNEEPDEGHERDSNNENIDHCHLLAWQILRELLRFI